MARLAAPYPMPTYSFDYENPKAPRPDFKSIDREQNIIMEKLEAESRAAVQAGKVVGFLLQFPVADGGAVYRVVKEKPFTIQHVPYMDGYRIDAAHIRGLRLEDAQQRVKWAKSAPPPIKLPTTR